METSSSKKIISSKLSPLQQRDAMIEYFHDRVCKDNKKTPNNMQQQQHELEVRFATKNVNVNHVSEKDSKRCRLNKDDYKHVIQRLLASGFKYTNKDKSGDFILRVFNHVDSGFQMIRTEINGKEAIFTYAKENNLGRILHPAFGSNKSLYKFITKEIAAGVEKSPNHHYTRLSNIFVPEYNYSLSYETETVVENENVKELLKKWNDVNKFFRYINRLTFVHPQYPVKVELSVVKSSKHIAGEYVYCRNVLDSKIFDSCENYEIEIEMDSFRASLLSRENLVSSMDAVITIVLQGLQQTSYPISSSETKLVQQEYLQMCSKDIQKLRMSSSDFIGPSAITLQVENLARQVQTSILSVDNPYCVTDKADGERRLLFVSKSGNIYLLSTSMQITFTGMTTENEMCKNSILDGEYIVEKNVFAAFDLYFLEGKSIRPFPFMNNEVDEIADDFDDDDDDDDKDDDGKKKLKGTDDDDNVKVLFSTDKTSSLDTGYDVIEKRKRGENLHLVKWMMDQEKDGMDEENEEDDQDDDYTDLLETSSSDGTSSSESDDDDDDDDEKYRVKKKRVQKKRSLREFLGTLKKSKNKKQKKTEVAQQSKGGGCGGNIFRYSILRAFVEALQPFPVPKPHVVSKTHFVIITKKFLCATNRRSIFDCCRLTYQRIFKMQKKTHDDNNDDDDDDDDNNEHVHNVYKTDGLIFTPALLGVGATRRNMNDETPLRKFTWEYNFKFKVQEDITIDFLVCVQKDADGHSPVLFTNPKTGKQFKVVRLLCGSGAMTNCWQKMLKGDFHLPSHNHEKKGGIYESTLFCPTDPYNSEAGFAFLPLDEHGNMCCRSFCADDIVDDNDDDSRKKREIFQDYSIIEFAFDIDAYKKKEVGVQYCWVPIRVRHDKMADVRHGNQIFGNDFKTANENWRQIHNAIPLSMLCDEKTYEEKFPKLLLQLSSDNNEESGLITKKYYFKNPLDNHNSTKTVNTMTMRTFHNFAKRFLLQILCQPGQLLVDFACGKGGDLSKWEACGLAFVLGLDISSDNLRNDADGACRRFLTYASKGGDVVKTKMIFAQVDCGKGLFGNNNINNNNMNDEEEDVVDEDHDEDIFENKYERKESKMILESVFGLTVGNERKKRELPQGVVMVQDIAKGGFHVGTCFFALHYFFKNVATLTNFLSNLSKTIRVGGYFTAICYDGQRVFKDLSKVPTNHCISDFDCDLMDNNIMSDERGGDDDDDVKARVFEHQPVWRIRKMYSEETFKDDESSLGYRINVFQDSINNSVDEYLVHADFFIRCMEKFGFVLVEKSEMSFFPFTQQCKKMTGPFADFVEEDENADNKVEKKSSSSSLNSLKEMMRESHKEMNKVESRISNLNRYYVFIHKEKIDNEELISII